MPAVVSLVVDDCLADPLAYRQAALRQPFGSIALGEQTFHGIAFPPGPELIEALAALLPAFTPTLTFLRQSPAGQREPNFVHSDAMMGDLTAILYLNPVAPADDGTTFWRFLPSGEEAGEWTAETEAASHDLAQWTPVETVRGRFNRLLVFNARRYHSRALLDNYGEGEAARLIHVVFGRYQ